MSLARKLLVLGVALTTIPLGIVGAVVWFTGLQAHRAAESGTHELADADLKHIVEVVTHTCDLFIQQRKRELSDALARTEKVVRGYGAVSIDPSQTAAWEAKNQFSAEVTQVQLPIVRVGSQAITKVTDAGARAGLVDEIRTATGAAATIFQRMNAAGDMLRISTTVVGKNGSRAIGTYIPAREADGRANPVVGSVLAGTTYIGRAFVVDAWYAAAYEPIKDRSGNVVGMLFVGQPEGTAVHDLLEKLKTITVGRTGYMFVLQGTGPAAGSYVLSQGRSRDGERIWDSRDADGRLFIQEIIKTALALKPGEFGDTTYPWKNPGDAEAVQKVAIYRYFEPWDWVIAASVRYDEFAAVTDEVATANRRANYALALVTIIAILAAGVTWTVVSRRLEGTLVPALQQLSEGSGQVVQAAGQVAASSQALSQGATEQAASLEETSASVEEIASMTRSNADGSRQAAGLMADVDVQVAQSNRTLGEMVTSMNAIRESSAKVSKIIKTIDEIAFQTNILALNAAVEAARAGEAGMGFAVVADEVRNLAHRSADAARDTASLIEESITISNEGTKKVAAVADSVGAITGSVSRVKTLVEQVSVASQQQAQGFDQISQAISQMEKVTQTTAATAEESAAASEELNAQAETSLSLVADLDRLIRGRVVTAAPALPPPGRSAAVRPAASAPSAVVIPMPGDSDRATGTYGRF